MFCNEGAVFGVQGGNFIRVKFIRETMGIFWAKVFSCLE